MDKHFTPENLESSLYKAWQEKGYFSPSAYDNPYCIMQPPPNVTGYLHMGHGFQITLMDALIRFHTMNGKNTLWQAGMDHAGIATQMVVERQLEAQGQTRDDLGREAFTEKVWDWKHNSASMIESQIQCMGAALDWDHQVFTLDPQVNDAVNHVFETLYDEGLIYRAAKLVNWDTSLQTAVSDLEVESVLRNEHLWHIQYHLVDSADTIIIATTRPETLFGDTAVAVNPNDPRYSQWIGKMLRLPVTGREIPIIADDYVDPDFGTGAVKITPGHDFNDHEVGKRHDLPLINILDPDGTLNETVPEAYRGLDSLIARQQLLEELEAQGHLLKTEPYSHQVPICERSGTVIQPLLTPQWFMAMSSLAEPAIQAVKKGDITFTPANWSKTYYQWLENIQDWCLSRQLWWGHSIPAWYDNEGQVYVGQSEAHVREKYTLSASVDLRQDNDVLDTWFSSALWPFVTLGWPENTDRLAFYPSSVLVTGFDIIFFWVARMVMMGLKLTGKVPFKEIYITGLIRDSHGQKMSKSKGNVLDPIDLIQGISLEDLLNKRCHAMMQPQMREKIAKQTRQAFPEGIAAHGTDALRFTFCALASTGRDINFELGRLGGYRNFCNKLWNASRYVMMQTEDFRTDAPMADLSIFDQWLYYQRNALIDELHKQFQQYRFDLIAHALYEFTWQIFCDWGLEFTKITLNQSDPKQRARCQHTLLTILADILRALHPIMPFITDAIWAQVGPKLGDDTPHLLKSTYPQNHVGDFSQGSADVETLQALISAVRSMRSDAQLSPQQFIDILTVKYSTQDDKAWLHRYEPWLLSLSKCRTLALTTESPDDQESMSVYVDELLVSIELSGLIDVEAEWQKVQTGIAKLEKAMQQMQRKLDNPEFLSNAPEAIVAKEKQKLADDQQSLQQLQSRQHQLEQMRK